MIMGCGKKFEEKKARWPVDPKPPGCTNLPEQRGANLTERYSAAGGAASSSSLQPNIKIKERAVKSKTSLFIVSP